MTADSILEMIRSEAVLDQWRDDFMYVTSFAVKQAMFLRVRKSVGLTMSIPHGRACAWGCSFGVGYLRVKGVCVNQRNDD